MSKTKKRPKQYLRQGSEAARIRKHAAIMNQAELVQMLMSINPRSREMACEILKPNLRFDPYPVLRAIQEREGERQHLQVGADS